MSDVDVPTQEEFDIQRTLKLMKLREKELTVESRLALERRLLNTPAPILAEAESRRRALTPQPKVGKLAPEQTSAEVKEFVKGRATLYAKGEDIGTGAQDGTMRKDIADKGVMEGLLTFFGGLDDKGVYTSDGVMKAVRLSSALGKSDEAKEFLKIARDNEKDVKRLMANRPGDLKKLLEQGEFGAMTVLIQQEIDSPQARLATGAQGAHQFREHGAHNPMVDVVLMSIEAGAPKSSWISAEAEQTAVEWVQQKVDAEVAELKGGNIAGGDSIGFKGSGIAAAAEVIADNLAAAKPAEKWALKGDGMVPTTWEELVSNSTKFEAKVKFERTVEKKIDIPPKGSKPAETKIVNKKETKDVGILFLKSPDALDASNTDIGITGGLARRKIQATAVAVAGPPTGPDDKLLDNPETTLVKGGEYYLEHEGSWQKIKLDEYEDAPATSTFRAVFRKTNDDDLTYTVYTCYPA